MEKVISLVTSGKATLSKGRHDDDFADRMSSRYTPLILIVFTIVVTIQQLVRTPITCWVPVHFTSSHQKYANNYCWVRSTYYLPFEDEVPRESEEKQMLTYYQWIQFIFLAQAVCFFLPTLVWRTFNSKAGVDADNILQTAHKIPKVDNAEKKEEMVEFLASQIDRFLESRKPTDSCQCDFKHFLSGFLCRCCGRRIGNYLVLLYIAQKILFILNIIGQFWALDGLLDNKFYTYGAEILRDPIPNHDWNSAHFVAFPRVTMCDVMVRRLGNNQRYTLQCVLPLNLYIEKMYVFLWFWMALVFLSSIVSFLKWIIRFIFRKERYNFITNHLYRMKELQTSEDMKLVDEFVDDYLRQDGAFLMRLVATNTNRLSTGVIIQGIWQFWLDKKYPDHKNNSEPSEAASEDSDDPAAEKARLMEETEVPNNVGLKHRKPESPEESRKPSNLTRAPTMYVRGNDTLGSKRPDSDLYPKINEIDKPKAADETPDSDDSEQGQYNTPLTKPSAPPEDDQRSSDESEPGTQIPPDPETQSVPESPVSSEPTPLYPDLQTGTTPVPKPRKTVLPDQSNVSPASEPQQGTERPANTGSSGDTSPVTPDSPILATTDL